jgi:uncharacterized SAM-binding protein YcdF (DUF218 family)
MTPGRALRLLRHLVGLLALGVGIGYTVALILVLVVSQEDQRLPAEAIVVLGAAQYNGRPSPVLQSRLDHALALYQEGLARRVVLTGGKQAGDAFTEATTGYNYLRARGLPDSALLKEVDGTTTWDSLKAVSRFLLPKGEDKVVLVTDGYHAMRAGAIADDLGFDASVSPSASHLTAAGEARALARETIAVSVGRLIGYDRLFRLEH